VVSTEPVNAIIDAMKMVDSSKPRIAVPPQDFTAAADVARDKKERWLFALYQRVSAQRRKGLIAEAFWRLLVHGRVYLQPFWVSDAIPKALVGTVPPVIVLVSQYDQCGTREGPLYTEAGYRKVIMLLVDAIQQFPEATFDLEPNQAEDTEVEIVDFWWVDKSTGRVWNAVLADGSFVRPPWETDYPIVPIIKIDGDYGTPPRGLLDPMVELWKYNCRLLTQAAQQVNHDRHREPPEQVGVEQE
jgi:hypothetical protein